MPAPVRNVQKPIKTSTNKVLFEEEKAEYKASSNPEDFGDDLIRFVQEQIDKMRHYNKLGNDGQANFMDVNEALMSYHNIQLALLSLHTDVKVKYIKAKNEYEEWYSSKYLSIRDEVNPRSISSQKWYSQKEIEMIVRTRFHDEFQKYHINLIKYENKLAFLRRLIDSWNAYQYILTQLSKNLIAEVNGLNVDSVMSNSSSMM